MKNEHTWDIITTLAPTSFTAEKIALAVPGTPAIPVLQKPFQGATQKGGNIYTTLDNLQHK